MKVMVTGKDGQAGKEILKSAPPFVELIALGHQDLDISSYEQIKAAVQHYRPDYIINAAAYTAVDKAESDAGQATSVNANGPGYLAKSAREIGARLVHYSTDFVFDGTKSSPYLPDDQVNPLSVYGRSKAEGENRIQEAWASGAIIVRTSWVYSTSGNNFVKTMIRLMNDRNELRIVADQTGSPTWAKTLATMTWSLVKGNVAPGIYHWSDLGTASWYDFAVAIYEEAQAINLLDRKIRIEPITTAEYPTAAIRPHYSVLDTRSTRHIPGMISVHWRTALRGMLIEYKDLLAQDR